MEIEIFVKEVFYWWLHYKFCRVTGARFSGSLCNGVAVIKFMQQINLKFDIFNSVHMRSYETTLNVARKSVLRNVLLLLGLRDVVLRIFLLLRSMTKVLSYSILIS